MHLTVKIANSSLMSHIQYFILINLLCLIIRHVNTLSWYERVHGHTDIFHETLDHEHCGKINLE